MLPPMWFAGPQSEGSSDDDGDTPKGEPTLTLLAVWSVQACIAAS